MNNLLNLCCEIGGDNAVVDAIKLIL